jgi:C4-dicarboxylate-specific signal transduction histidine kinase/ActR/RegA family two-component response regulator
MRYRSIRFKINFAILATCALIALIFGSIMTPYIQSRRRLALERIRTLCSALYQQGREAIANEIFAGQMLALAESIKEFQAVKEICRVGVYNASGELIMSSGGALPPLDAQRRELLANGPLFLQRQVEGLPVAEFTTAIDVIGERTGYLTMYFDLTAEGRDTVQAVVFFIALLATMLLIMVTLLNRLLDRSVIRPALHLRDALVQARAGNWGEQLSLPASDEIGEIAAAFNEMAARLRQQHSEISRAISAKESYAGRLEATNMALEQLNARLEERVDERTIELRLANDTLMREIEERQRLDQDRKRLEERLARSQKMEALGLLAGGVAHDLNNVLSGLVSYPDLLLMDMPPEHSLRKPIEVIRDSGNKAAAIVQDLLTLARRGVVNTSVLNLNAVIGDYLRSPEHAALRSFHPAVRIETRLADDLLNIRGSMVHLRKALMNLVSNAAEAQPAGGLVRTGNRYVDRPIEGYDSVVEGDYVVLTVADDGIGIAPEDLKRIFEPFYTKKVMGRSGTGLGMAVVWGTVQDHRGYINVTSSQGAGTSFELYLPVCREALSDESGALPVEQYRGKGERILVVDDMPEQRQIASRILQRLGYHVETAPSGEAAVEMLRQTRVDLVMLDMIMDPGMDGLDTYRSLLAIRPGQRAIIASGYAENERVREAQRLGAGFYLRKPYTLERIGLAVRDELARQRPQPGAL